MKGISSVLTIGCFDGSGFFPFYSLNQSSMFSMFRISVEFLRVTLIKSMKWVRCWSAM